MAGPGPEHDRSPAPLAPLGRSPRLVEEPHGAAARAPSAKVGSPGKQPLERDWIRDADDRSAQSNGQGAELRYARITKMYRHLGTGGNVGMAVPAGVIVVDADDQAAVEFVAKCSPVSTPRQRTARGTHFVFRLPAGTNVVNSARHALPGGGIIDVRSHGSQVVVEPSRHPSGQLYHWEVVLSEDVDALPVIPDELLDAIAHQESKPAATAVEPDEDVRRLPAFPVGVLPDWLQRVVTEGARATEAETHRAGCRTCRGPLRRLLLRVPE